jgi:hypothetical protein
MSGRFTESTVEDADHAWLEAAGWRIAHGPDIAPDHELDRCAGICRVQRVMRALPRSAGDMTGARQGVARSVRA